MNKMDPLLLWFPSIYKTYQHEPLSTAVLIVHANSEILSTELKLTMLFSVVLLKSAASYPSKAIINSTFIAGSLHVERHMD